MKKPKPAKNAAGRIPEVTINYITDVNQVAEVPPKELLERRVSGSIMIYQARNQADAEFNIRPEDRTAFLLGWMACAAAVKQALKLG